MSPSRGIALVAVLALLACLAMLVLAMTLHVTAGWLAARNLREGTIAWSRVVSAEAAAVEALGASFRRDGELPAAFRLAGADEMDVTVSYVRTSPATATLDLTASFGRAAVRRETWVDLAR